jgi:hypothetical protein
LSDKVGKVDFFVDSLGTNNLSGSIFKARGNGKLYEIDSIKLSSIIKQNKFDLIKIDVEGAERQIFIDLMENNLIECSTVYFIEYHHQQALENIFTLMINEFQSKGFQFNLRSYFSKPKPVQDILIGFYKE